MSLWTGLNAFGEEDSTDVWWDMRRVKKVPDIYKGMWSTKIQYDCPPSSPFYLVLTGKLREDHLQKTMTIAYR